MEHYDYTIQEIRNLCSVNPKLAFLNECLDSYPTEVMNADSSESGEEEKKVWKKVPKNLVVSKIMLTFASVLENNIINP